jgi:CBS-domain-containing membrane protein
VIAADIMVREVVTIGPDESVAHAAALMTANDVSALPVISIDGRLVGSSVKLTCCGARKLVQRSAVLPGWKRSLPRRHLRPIS